MTPERKEQLKGFADRLNTALDEHPFPSVGRHSSLADHWKVSQKEVHGWLTGEAYPSLDRLMHIADWLGISLDWLLWGRGEPPSHDYSPQIRSIARKLMDDPRLLTAVEALMLLHSNALYSFSDQQLADELERRRAMTPSEQI